MDGHGRTACRAVAGALAIALIAGGSAVAYAAGEGAGPPTSRSVALEGSGSTLAQEFLTRAIAGFEAENPDVTVRYAGGGSGKGRTDFAAGVMQFAAADFPYTPETRPDFDYLYIPTIVSPVTVAYNLPEVADLRFRRETIAGIFQGRITSWDDPAIQDGNPGSVLPSMPITVVHRSDSSGTTQNLSLFLHLVTTEWTLGEGPLLEWPAGTIGVEGNDAVAEAVRNTPGAVGYADLDSSSAELEHAKIENSSGQFVEPTARSARAAVITTKLTPRGTYIPINTQHENGYPITAATYLIVAKEQPNAAVARALKTFLTYIQDHSAELAPPYDAPIPPAYRKEAKAAIAKITAG